MVIIAVKQKTVISIRPHLSWQKTNILRLHGQNLAVPIIIKSLDFRTGLTKMKPYFLHPHFFYGLFLFQLIQPLFLLLFPTYGLLRLLNLLRLGPWFTLNSCLLPITIKLTVRTAALRPMRGRVKFAAMASMLNASLFGEK